MMILKKKKRKNKEKSNKHQDNLENNKFFHLTKKG